jgi:hypothetical protein
MVYRFDNSNHIESLGFSIGMQEMAWQLKGKVAKCERREYGFAQIQVEKSKGGADALFGGLGDELEVRGGSYNAAHSDKLTCKFSRSGCPMGINFPKSLPTSMSLGTPPTPPSPLSPTMTNRGTVFSSTPKSLTLHAVEKSSESSFLAPAAVRLTGQWSVMRGV